MRMLFAAADRDDAASRPGGLVSMTVRVAAGAHAWETSELAWVPVGEVTAGRQLHPAFADAWPALRERIEASVRAPALPTPRCPAPVGWRGLS